MALVVATLVPDEPSQVRQADPAGADVVEVRLDGLDLDDVEPTVQATEGPVLATCRREEDGGVQALPEEQRRRRLEAAVEAGAGLVDVEVDADFRRSLTEKARRANATVIVSEHALDDTPAPDEILDTLETLADLGDVAKLATAAETPEDVNRLLDAGLQAPTIGCPFALMGVGDATLRGLAGPMGQALVYAAPGESEVPGQLPARLQARLPRDPPAPQPLEDYALIGHPVEHSLSPPMQEAGFRRLGLEARYRLIDAEPDRLDAVLDGLVATSDGANVTAPHKQAAYERADRATETAREVGAANTLRVDGDEVVAHITDGLGAVDALEHRGEALDGRPALVVGAGGTGRAVAHALTDAGVEVTLANRTRKKAERVAEAVDARVVDLDPDALAEAIGAGTVVVNATPVDPPVPDEALAEAIAFDANYAERATFARRARQAGARTLDGLDLLVGQGVRSLAFWTEREIPETTRGRMSTAARTRAIERRHRGDA